MLPEPGRRAAQADPRAGHRDRAVDEAHALAFAVALDQHLVVQRLRVDQRFAQIPHGRAEDVDRLQPRQPVLAGIAGVALAEDGLQRRLVLELLRQVAIARIGRQVVDFQRRADVAQRIGLEGAHHHQRPRAGVVHAAQGHGRPVDLGIGHQDHGGFLHLHRQHGVVQGHADLLALAGTRAVQQRQQDALHHVHASRIVRQRRRVDRDRHRCVRAPRHHAGYRLGQHVLAALECVGAGFAIAGADRVDDARVERLAIVVAQAHALHDAGAEVVDDDVGAGDQRLHLGHVRRIAQIQRHAALVPVQAAEDRVVGAGHGFEGGAAEIARALALDLDDVGAVVAQRLRADRPHHHLGEIDHAHAAQRQVLCISRFSMMLMRFRPGARRRPGPGRRR